MAKSKNACKTKANKRITKKEKLEKQGIEQGYKVVIILPDGKKLMATHIGLEDNSDIYHQPVVFDTKEQANRSAKLLAKTYCKAKGIEVRPTTEKAYAPKEKIIKSKSAAPADKPKATAKSSDKKSYTVRQGNSYKTFKTKTEAQTCAAQSKSKATITEGTKKPTHRVVKFTARK